MLKIGILITAVLNTTTGSYWAFEDFTHETLFTCGSLEYVLSEHSFICRIH